MPNYEIMFIVNPNATEDEIDKIDAQLESIITSGNGQIEKIEKMGKRRLSYEVKKFREGYYVLFAISANGEIVKECERRLRVMDLVLRYITVRMDEDVRRFEKIRRYRQKRAARRGSNAAEPATPAAEEARQ